MKNSFVDIEQKLGFELPSELKDFYRIITAAKNTLLISLILCM